MQQEATGAAEQQPQQEAAGAAVQQEATGAAEQQLQQREAAGAAEQQPQHPLAGAPAVVDVDAECAMALPMWDQWRTDEEVDHSASSFVLAG